MGGFLVEPDELGPLCTLLRGYAYDAADVSRFITKEAGMSVQDQGLLFWLTGGHEHVLNTALARVRMMNEAGYEASTAVRETIHHYVNTDESSAAELDAVYGDGEPVFPAGYHDKRDNDFAEEADASQLLVLSRDVADLEPKADEIEQAIRDLGNLLSSANWIRDWLGQLLAAYGCSVTDPIGWVIEWFSGDWKAWARCALVWEACSAAATQMSRNLEYIPPSTVGVWEGNAAEHAVVYFNRLTSATATEALAFEGFSGRYEIMMELCHSHFQLVNDNVNIIIDIFVGIFGSLVSAALTGVSLEELAYVAVTLVDLVANIVSAVTTVIDVVKLFNDIVLVGDLPEVPPSELPALKIFDAPGGN